MFASAKSITGKKYPVRVVMDIKYPFERLFTTPSIFDELVKSPI